MSSQTNCGWWSRRAASWPHHGSMPNGRGRPPPPPLTLAQPPVAALAPRCAQRSAGSGGPLPARVTVPRRESSRGRGEVLKEAGGLRPPASLRSSPRGAARSGTCAALRAAQCRERRASPPLTAVSATPSRRRGPLGCAPRSAPLGSGGFARKGVRPKASQSAKDFLIGLPERDNSSLRCDPGGASSMTAMSPVL